MVLDSLSLAVESVILRSLGRALESLLLRAAQSRGGGSEGACGEHDVSRGCLAGGECAAVQC